MGAPRDYTLPFRVGDTLPDGYRIIYVSTFDEYDRPKFSDTHTHGDAPTLPKGRYTQVWLRDSMGQDVEAFYSPETGLLAEGGSTLRLSRR
jgi:hypothetical protein